MSETFNHAFDFAFEVSGLNEAGDTTPAALRDALLTRALTIPDGEVREACESYDCHPDSEGRARIPGSATGAELTHSLRLIQVYYGEEVGLVSLTLGCVLANAMGSLRCLHGAPSVVIPMLSIAERYGTDEDHNWSHVVLFLTAHYDWKQRILREPNHHAAQDVADTYPISDWRYEVVNGDTRLGLDDWRAHKLESDAEPTQGITT